jgi:hypothetical protein
MASSCSPIRQNFRRQLSDSLLADMSIFSENNYFLTIGRVTPWETEVSAGLSSSYASTVPLAVDSDETETGFWENIVAAKRLTQDNLSLVIPRFDWKLGAVYEPYRNSSDLFNDVSPVRFYVLVDETRVYKCIDNYYNASSLVAPTHTDSEIRKLSDGYRWKFLYMIPESKRKFITKTIYDETDTRTGSQRVTTQGYIPVEKVDYLKIVDEERSLQWNVQESAVDGEISFVELKQEYRPYLTAINCILPDNGNSIQQSCVAGHTGSIRVYSPFLIGVDNFYNDLIFSVDSGAGEGQRRVIQSYSYSLTGNYGNVTLSDPLTLGLSGSGSNISKFSIVPNLQILGDGSSNDTYLNQFDEADITIKFGPGLTTSRDSCTTTNIYNQTLIDSFEMVDTGYGYSRAEFNVVKGLTFTAGFTGTGSLNDAANIVLSPPGGHGKDAVRELGAASVMVVLDFNQDEQTKLSVNNDYRQFGIIKNPLLKKPQTRLRFQEWGLSGSFKANSVLTQSLTGAGGVTGFDGAIGNILSWDDGVTGYYGSSELVIESVTGGAFFSDGIVSSITGAASSGNFTIIDIDQRTVAGTEGREVLRLKITPALGISGSSFNPDGSDFRPGLWVNSIGNKASNISNSRFSGLINRWEPAPGNNALGTLFIEDASKLPTRLEKLVESDFFMRPTKGITGATGTAKIIDIGEITRDSASVYDQTTSISLLTTVANVFSENSFVADQFVRGMTGTNAQGTGLVVEWTPNSAGYTGGVLRLCGVKGNFTNTNIQFVDSSSLTANAATTNILHEEDLLYRSGQLVYIQNTQPIKRNIEQREEIKVLFQF